jgi:hypothetical protein
MDRSLLWERAGAASGIVFVALLLASFVVIPDSPPALDDAVGEIRSFYVDNASAWQANAFLTGLAGFFLLCFAGSLVAALGRVDPAGATRHVIFPAVAIALALAFAGTAVNDTLATRVAAESDQAVIRALYDVQAFTFTLGAFPLAVFVGAVSVVSRRTPFLPPLTTWLGFVVALGWLVNGCAVFVESGEFSPTGAVGLVVLLGWLAWTVAVSASLLRRSGRPVADAP